MQYLLGLSKFTEKPVFVPELFVLIRKRLGPGLLCLVFAKTGLEALKKRLVGTIDGLVGVLTPPQVCWGRINMIYKVLDS